MKKCLVCFTVIVTTLVVLKGESMIGPGRWYVLNIQQCPNHDQYEYQFFVQRKKLTRDQDCYNANMKLDGQIDDTFAIRIDLCKHVDGGCKPYQVLSDDSMVRFVEKYAKKNVEEALTLANVDPPEFPLNPGEYGVKDYVFNYCELPTDGVYGKFGVEAYLIKDQKDVGCVSFLVEFREVDGACDGDDVEESNEK